MSDKIVEPVTQLPGIGALSLTDEIRAFTQQARERLPADYIGKFVALIDKLITDEVGKRAPAVGDAFPDFILEDEQAKQVRAGEHWGGKNLIVKFYRGGWCPYCNLELNALERHAPELAVANAELLAIAPEKITYRQETKKKTGASFKFLWDEKCALAKQLGIAFEIGDAVRDIYLELDIDLLTVNGEWVLPIPATFVVRDGIVRYRFIDADYMKRQDPVDLLGVLRELNDMLPTGAVA